MKDFILPVQLRWSDIDFNLHIRHTIYFEWGAMSRMHLLAQQGITLDKMHEHQILVILFREECVFRREIRLEDSVTIDLKVTKARRDFSRFSIQHDIKKEKEKLAATINTDIAWMSGITRKLTLLPPEFIEILSGFPRSVDFQWQDDSK